MEWVDVTTHDQLLEYIKEHIGMDNLYDELYEDLLHGMIRNRESKQRLEKLMDSSNDAILINPSSW